MNRSARLAAVAVVAAPVLVASSVAAPAMAERSSSTAPSTGAVSNEEALPLYLADFRPPGRLVIGFDFGLGLIDSACAGCSPVGGVSANGFVGVQVSRRVAVLAQGFSVIHLLASDGDRSGLATHSIGTVSARVWVTPELWFEAGGGVGRFASVGRDDAPSLAGPAAQLSIGGEPGHRPCGGIDLSLRVGGSWLGDDSGHDLLYNLTALVGIHWN